MTPKKQPTLKPDRPAARINKNKAVHARVDHICTGSGEPAASCQSKSILTLKKVPRPVVHNPYGFERIQVLQFNYDGKGGALVRFDNGKDLECLFGSDLEMILLGEPYSGQRWYRPE